MSSASINTESSLIKLSKANVKVRKINISGYLINYVTSGSKGSTLLLIHGANIGWGQWYKNIKDLSKNYKVIALDLPGSGNSSKINYEKTDFDETFLYTVKSFINTLKIDKLNIVGHSVGAVIALRLALDMKSKIEKVIIVNPLGLTDFLPLNQFPLSNKYVAKFLSKTVLKPSFKNMDNFLKSVLINKNSVSSDFVKYFHSNIVRQPITHPIMFMHSLLDGFNIKKNLLVIDKLKEIIQPVLIIIGDSDPMLPVEMINEKSKLIPNSKLLIYEATGHVPSLERSVRFNKDVISFLKES